MWHAFNHPAIFSVHFLFSPQSILLDKPFQADTPTHRDNSTSWVHGASHLKQRLRNRCCSILHCYSVTLDYYPVWLSYLLQLTTVPGCGAGDVRYNYTLTDWISLLILWRHCSTCSSNANPCMLCRVNFKTVLEKKAHTRHWWSLRRLEEEEEEEGEQQQQQQQQEEEDARRRRRRNTRPVAWEHTYDSQ